VIVILAGYILNSLGPTIFKTKQAVDQFGKEIEKQNAETDVENLLKKIKNDQDLSGLNLSGLDLTGYDLSGKNLSNVKFNQSDLTDVDFTNSNLYGASFESALIFNTNFSNMDLTNTSGIVNVRESNFHGANLSGLKLQGMFLLNDFTDADLSGITSSKDYHVTGIKLDLSRNDFTNADLSDSYLFGGKGSGDNRRCVDLGNAGKYYGIIWFNDFTNADLSGTTLDCYDMKGNIFTNANLENILLIGKLKNIDDSRNIICDIPQLKQVIDGGWCLECSAKDYVCQVNFK